MKKTSLTFVSVRSFTRFPFAEWLDARGLTAKVESMNDDTSRRQSRLPLMEAGDHSMNDATMLGIFERR